MDLSDKLAALHETVLEELLRRIKAGEAKPADLSAAIKLLQHNNIQSTPEASNGKLEELLKSLPEYARDED